MVYRLARPTLVLLALLFATPAVAEDPLWIELPAEERSKPLSGTVEAQTFARLAERLSPAVVLIRVSLPQHPLLTPEPGNDGFQDGGTGFVIRPDGYILTNAHVVESASGIKARFDDDRELDATLIGAYPLADLALLKVKVDAPLVAAPLGDSSQLRIAEWVLAIGSPFGLNNSVTAGIISAKGRKDITPGNRPVYADFIQTDASINPGNSGGPLINMRGEVIGINSAIYQSAQGIGFAIPVNMAKALLPQLAKGKVDRSYLGISPQEFTKQHATALGLDKAEGALVAQVIPGSPAAEAGLEVGDIIVSFNGSPVKDSVDLRWLASIAGVGAKVPLEVLRKGKRQAFSVTMVAVPEGRQAAAPKAKVSGDGLDLSSIGLQIRALTKKERAKAKIPRKRGVMVTDTTRDGPAAAAGIRKGDIVLRFGYAAVLNPKSLARMVDQAKAGIPITLLIQRNGRTAWVVLRKL